MTKTPAPTETPVPEGFGYSRVFGTRWNDNDVYGHLNNTTHYAAMDTTITSWLIGIAGLRTDADDAMAVVVSSSCTYLASVSFPEGLVVGLRAGRLGTTSVTWELGLHAESSGALVATGQFVHVFVDPVGQRPVPIPRLVRDAIESQLVMAG
ncbi:acyl-CoA thioesterase [Glaciihabitans sp. INWT7]|uniref:acyl-CoA thioesterase n=1 Tax=Glaciihabitans sp. INWT7 TaxID=2596912 RepID=UPI00162319FA|nr:thioesterase family protein [Glaciihabitans sp. INWT7]QNE47103.1 acyl-CoA thioesterase [Glaciihabitans sp. INWT7]